MPPTDQTDAERSDPPNPPTKEHQSTRSHPRHQRLTGQQRATSGSIDSPDSWLETLGVGDNDRASDPASDADGDDAALGGRLTDLEAQLTELTTRLDEMDAALQAVRGYTGSLRATNNRVERRADRALAATEELRASVEPLVAMQPQHPHDATLDEQTDSGSHSQTLRESALADARDTPADSPVDAALEADSSATTASGGAATDAGSGDSTDQPRVSALTDRLGDLL